MMAVALKCLKLKSNFLENENEANATKGAKNIFEMPQKWRKKTTTIFWKIVRLEGVCSSFGISSLEGVFCFFVV